MLHAATELGLAETEDENNLCLKTFGLRPIDYLKSVN
jgi:8-oxoguanine deaminase